LNIKKIHNFRLLFLSLFILFSFDAHAVDLQQQEILLVAKFQHSMTVDLNGEIIPVIYVGKDQECEAVSIMWTDIRIENFRVCNGIVKNRGTVSPAWDKESGKPVFQAVVKDTVLYGKADLKDENGYLVSGRSLRSLNPGCANIEMIISYDMDLVDRDVHEVCGERPMHGKMH
jgi:hypothetical protein